MSPGFRVQLHALAAVTLIVGSPGLAAPAWADPPGRVARISEVAGPVSFKPANDDEWAEAIRNYPVTTGDHLWTDRGGRVEVEFGSVFLWLAPATELSVLNLDDEIAQLRMTQGTATIRVREDIETEGHAIEVDTPRAAVLLEAPGFYRIDVDEAGTTTVVTSRTGRASVDEATGTYVVYARQSLAFDNLSAPYFVTGGQLSDDFEEWSVARDRRAERSRSAQYVSPAIVGYADLDDYGVWRSEPEFGQVWFPRVAADWVPYRFGHWAWVEPWGWTWIDDEPWGFAPFHYGRWIQVRGGWAWIPGERHIRPVYSPALVAFIDSSGWQAAFSVGSAPVAWFPLGPREPWVPGYRVSPTYLHAVNAPCVDVRGAIDVGRVRYANREFPGAVTAVPREAFVRARPVSRSAIAVSRDAFRDARPIEELPERPARGNTGRADRPGRVPPAAAIDRSVIVRRPPSDEARDRFKNVRPVQPQVLPVRPAPPEQSARPEPAPAPRVREPQRLPPVAAQPQERQRQPRAEPRREQKPPQADEHSNPQGETRGHARKRDR